MSIAGAIFSLLRFQRTGVKILFDFLEHLVGLARVQGGSPVKKVRIFLKAEAARAFIILAFKIINKGRKVAWVSIILIFKKAGNVERCLSPSTLFTEHRTLFSWEI